jgi:AcrR family transcriptional regulator
MNENDIPDPVQGPDGIPEVIGDGLASNAKLAWLHVRYTQLDPKHPQQPAVPRQNNEGVAGYIWYGSLSFVIKDLWPALREQTGVTQNALTKINQYLRGTNNMVCLDPGRMDQVSRQRKTHRLPEWWVADEWQVMTVTWPHVEASTDGEQMLQEPELRTESADVFDIDAPLLEIRLDPTATAVPDPETTPELEPDPAQDADDAEFDPFVCRVGCDRTFQTGHARTVHENHHEDVTALLDTAALLLRESNGDPSSISVLALAESAGTSRQAVHNHFKTKHGLLQAAARLRGAPLYDAGTGSVPEPAGPAPDGLTEAQWESGRRKVLTLAAFAQRNGTPLTDRMLIQVQWELNVEQREQIVYALGSEGLLVTDTVRNAYGQAKAIVVAADPDAVLSGVAEQPLAPLPTPAAPFADPVQAVKAMVARYEEMELQEALWTDKLRVAEGRADEAESVREELDSLKSAVAALRAAALGIAL